MIIEREKLMVPPLTIPNSKTPNLKNAHFINPNPNSQNHPFPKPPINPISINPETLKSLTKSINFKGIKIPNDSWKSWVNTLEKTHENSWKKVGIFDAIKASTFTVKRDDELIIKLASFWCPESNTFVFPWGECTITLEDVMILGGFTPLGETVINVKERNDLVDVHLKLINSCLDIKRRNNYHIPFNEWIRYFKGKSDDFELEHVGFLVQWLSRYVFCVNQFDVDVNVFPFAENLSVGCRIALAPAVLAAIYSDLTLLKQRIVAFSEGGGGGGGGEKLVLWSPMQLVLIWAWERFPVLSPKPNCLGVGEPRIARWHKSSKVKIDGVGGGVDLEKCGDGFLWRPYALDLENWEFQKFYCEDGMYVDVGKEGEVDEEWLSFARCLGVSELVGMDCVEQYLPHRVAMQFGFDQDIADFVPRLNSDLKVAWSSYDKPLDGVRLYVPPRLFEGEVTEEYSKLWVRVSPPDEDALNGSEKKRRRRKQGSGQKVKKTASTSASDKETLVINGESSEVMASQVVNANNETISHCVTGSGSSQPANLIDKIDSIIAGSEDTFLEPFVEPPQVQDTEKTSSVLAEDEFAKIVEELSQWKRDYL